MWGQRFAKNQKPHLRARIAWGAHLLAASGDDEVLNIVRAKLLAQADGQQQPADVAKLDDVDDELAHDVEKIIELDAKLGEGRVEDRHGPGGTRTKDGHFVRSKSEREIANFLFDNKIRYQYERPTRIAGVELKPDFYLPDVAGGLHLEHFGMLDNDRYRYWAEQKSKLFQRDRKEWIATDERDALDMDSALRSKLGKWLPELL